MHLKKSSIIAAIIAIVLIITITLTILVLFLEQPGNNNEKIVCIGDSITAGFSGNGYSYEYYLAERLQNWTIVNKGVYGQNSSQIIDRFGPDVLYEKPKYVIILAGTNDIYQDVTPQIVESNLVEMYTIAEKNHIKPIVCTLLPVNIYNETEKNEISIINEWVRDYSAHNNLTLIDFYRTMEDPVINCAMNNSYTSDGVHPNKIGYKVMGESINTEIFE